MTQENRAGLRRRAFLQVAAGAAAGLTIVPARAVTGTQANTVVRLGLIGCGGRGRWIGDLFEKSGQAKVVAAHDYFRDRVDTAGDLFGVDAAKRFTGLDGYKGLLAADVDAVAVESPPYFHPEHAAAAIEAGKHVYIAKPAAVDVPGCTKIADAARKGDGKLSMLVDFQTRNNEFFRGAAQRIREGMIGRSVCGQMFYHTNRLNPQAPPGTETARLRNWVFDKALSGDIIVEQNIHVLDVSNWYIGAHPVRAYGTGGRKARTDVGDCWDHFIVTFWYPDDVLVDFASTQFLEGFNDMCMRLFGTEGTVDSHYGGEVSIRGRKTGWRGGETRDIYREGAANNIRDFCTSIVEGKYLNNIQDGLDSTMTSILGRIAAYENRVVTWEEMVQANQALDPRLDLPPNGPDSTA